MGEPQKKMQGPLSHECDSKRIESVTLYNPKHTLVQSSRSKRRIAAYHFIFFIAYMYQVTWMGRTIGVPYQEFVLKAEREGFEGECASELKFAEKVFYKKVFSILFSIGSISNFLLVLCLLLNLFGGLISDGRSCQNEGRAKALFGGHL
jgi:hypothetical protein